MNTQLSEAPVREPAADGGGPAIRIATAAPDRIARGRLGTPSPSSSSRTSRCYYGSFRAVRNVDVKIAKQRDHRPHRPVRLRQVDAPADHQPDERPGARPIRSEGRILLDGQDLFAKSVDPVAVRRRVGMVFQKPNPFPKSICDNVAFGPKINGYKGDLDELVEHSLRRAALWDDVKDKLKQSGMALSGGQQQRLCIARTIAVEPEVILMDEPCSALDPRSTLQIEELMARAVKRDYTIVIVTHNMQQAARASDTTVFMTMGEDRAGYVVEQGETVGIFTNPKNQLTEDYVSGRFG